MRSAVAFTLCLLFISPVARPDDANLKNIIVKVLAEQYGRAAIAGMTFGDFTSSANPAYLQVSVSSPRETGSYSKRVSISRDGRYVAESRFYPLNASTWQDDCARTARSAYGLTDRDRVTVGEPEDSVVTGYQQGILTVIRSGESQKFGYDISEDRRFLVLGAIFVERSPEELEARFSRATGEPDIGNEHAPVTIVEFADFQCPDCARMQAALGKILARYEGKIRFVFRDFPLPYHAWAKRAAVVGRCVYRVDREGYLSYRSLVFQHQGEIAEGDSSKNLLDVAAKAGANRESVASCVEDKAVLSEVERDFSEAVELQIRIVPMTYINGQGVAGYVGPEDLTTLIEACLH
ncbi:MAG TPA: DsbA family protein [Bryobacteraceae bacterium]|jgi:protein-disulfide isomerase|nr:DsbA family protein [Bryobacteraceae bacterium]